MIPRVPEGFELPQGLSYKIWPGTFCLFLKIGSRIARIRLSKRFSWVWLEYRNSQTAQ